MKQLLLVLLVLILLSAFFLFAKEKVKQDFAKPLAYPTITVLPSLTPSKAGPEQQSLFVPYWTVSDLSDEADYDSYLYFGVVPTIEGLDAKEIGAQRIDKFLSLVPSDKEKLLVIRMIDRESNFAILKDKNAQERLIRAGIDLAREKGFDGIVLDLEISAIPFDSLVQQITAFNKLFNQEVKKQDLSYSLTIYGDVFYRVRPFDVKALAEDADQIMIMAYDFSKAKGNPGPNFPLRGREIYGYDYEKMIEDFMRVIPAEKLTVVFGLFGYDWVVDNKEKAIQQGKALSTQEIEKAFIEECTQKSCSFKRESKSSETEVRYTDQEDRTHIVWFEDMKSVAEKKAFLKKHGVSSFSFWANSYF